MNRHAMQREGVFSKREGKGRQGVVRREKAKESGERKGKRRGATAAPCLKKGQRERELIGWKRKEDPLALAEGGEWAGLSFKGTAQTITVIQRVNMPTMQA